MGEIGRAGDLRVNSIQIGGVLLEARGRTIGCGIRKLEAVPIAGHLIVGVQ
jgi:hypothetical protein